MTKSLLAAIAAITLLAGCASHGVMVSPERVATLKKGEATEADVIATLGQPTTVTNANGVRLLMYSGAHAQARPASFIPFIGPLVGGTDVKASAVLFRFGADGRLADVTSTHSTSGSGSGLAAGAPIEQTPDTPRRVE